jgi:hypothetical protein
MASKETNITNKIRLALSGISSIFRNNRGVYKDGNRVIRYGVGPNGASDLIGWTCVEVTPDMVGKTVAVFTAIEVKTPDGTVKADQQTFVDNVRAAGGLAGIARSADDAIQIVKSPTD